MKSNCTLYNKHEYRLWLPAFWQFHSFIYLFVPECLWVGQFRDSSRNYIVRIYSTFRVLIPLFSERNKILKKEKKIRFVIPKSSKNQLFQASIKFINHHHHSKFHIWREQNKLGIANSWLMRIVPNKVNRSIQFRISKSITHVSVSTAVALQQQKKIHKNGNSLWNIPVKSRWNEFGY